MPVREYVAERDISVNRLQRYAHTIGFGLLEQVLCQWESMIRYVLSPWSGDDDILMPSASVYSKRYCAAESDDMYHEDFTR